MQFAVFHGNCCDVNMSFSSGWILIYSKLKILVQGERDNLEMILKNQIGVSQSLRKKFIYYCKFN